MNTQAYFEEIQPKIISELQKAQQSIFVAVAWFTDQKLFHILCDKASQNVQVEVLILNSEINEEYGVSPQRLAEKGGKMHSIGSNDEMMHNKFCVIDQAVVITGSYNWTRKAAEKNDENITITKGSKELATDFLLEFKRLKQKYLHEPTAFALDMDAVVKRMEILQKTIALQDEEDIDYQMRKLYKLVQDEQEGDFAKIHAAKTAIEAQQYGEAARMLNELLTRFKTIVTWEDPEISGLKLEVHALGIQLGSLEDEYNEMAHTIRRFEAKHNQILGALILRILALQKVLAQREAEQHPHNESKQQQKEEAEQDYNSYQQNKEAQDKQARKDLNQAEEKQAKQLYRAISKQAHPDKVNDSMKARAEELFVQAKNAYDAGDLKALEEILDYLEKGQPFEMKHQSLREKEALRAEIQRLQGKITALMQQLQKLQDSETWQLLQQIEDWTAYFENTKSKLEENLLTLEKEL